jgi:hypothetical protein
VLCFVQDESPSRLMVAEMMILAGEATAVMGELAAGRERGGRGGFLTAHERLSWYPARQFISTPCASHAPGFETQLILLHASMAILFQGGWMCLPFPALSFAQACSPLTHTRTPFLRCPMQGARWAYRCRTAASLTLYCQVLMSWRHCHLAHAEQWRLGAAC